MEFFCGTGLKRPVRLSEKTRDFAKRSLEGLYGDENYKTMYVSVDGIHGFDEMDAPAPRAQAPAKKKPVLQMLEDDSEVPFF